jgi:hypothetical protein
VCVDGPAGAGKTTFANSLLANARQLRLRARLIHLDDMYDGWQQGLNSIGPRLRNYLVGPLASGHSGRYHRYDWHLGQFADWVSVPSTELLILEGVGSGHSNIASRRASLVWLDADPNLCLELGLARDGEGMREQWLEWKVKESEYFAQYSLPERADFIVETTNAQ